MKEVIFCVGDSHVNLFSGVDESLISFPDNDDKIPFLKTFNLGPATAYNLCQLKSRSRAREKLFFILKTIDKGRKILFNFGEIDCRVHLLNQARVQNKDINEIVQGCVDRYFSVVLEVRDMGYEVLVFGVTPTVDFTITKEIKMKYAPYPIIGTGQERNEVTKIFNEKLKTKCEQNQVPFISIYDKLVDETGKTKGDYFWDEIHVNQGALHFVLEELEKLWDND